MAFAMFAERVHANVTVAPPGTFAGAGEANICAPGALADGVVGVNCSAVACPVFVTSRRSWGFCPTLTFACESRTAPVRAAGVWMIALAELGPVATTAAL
ncbi:MAG TPA: hypothetical protein VKJ07_06285, partial [Mycobacteriales bacterium]|nr:hypothetical protein [Mycobacteriales bacterium]